MNEFDNDIYASEEYKARIERAFRSLTALATQRGDLEAINTAAESIAYWQMRAVTAEKFVHKSDRDEL